MKEYASNPDFQILNTSHGYGTLANALDISHCTRLKYFTPVTVIFNLNLLNLSLYELPNS